MSFRSVMPYQLMMAATFGITAVSPGFVSKNNRIEKFTNNGTWIWSAGSVGPGPGQFNFPQYEDIDSQNRVYVVDRGARRVEVFDSNGNYLSQISGGGPGPGQAGGDKIGRAARPEETPATTPKDDTPGRPKGAVKARSEASGKASIPRPIRDRLRDLAGSKN